MGSTGTGRFSDYPGSARSEQSDGGFSGGDSGEDRCDKAFSTTLEDYERSGFSASEPAPPSVGTGFEIRLESRLTAYSDGGVSLGFLPTEYNYLAGCIRGGREYRGIITGVDPGIFVTLHVDVAPVQ